jgi:hypothetical protein
MAHTSRLNRWKQEQPEPGENGKRDIPTAYTSVKTALYPSIDTLQ